mgnify:CR=1 FL=1
MIEVVAVERMAPQPWRNGGGFTRELLAWPSADDWQLRISVAEIARDGAFSVSSLAAGVQKLVEHRELQI